MTAPPPTHPRRTLSVPATVAPPQPAAAPAAGANPHYRLLGGEPAVRQLVAHFYDAMDRRSDAMFIRALHPADLGQARERLFQFLSGWLGGPPLYAERHGPPRLRRAHAAFAIDAAARDAWMACMDQALGAVVRDPGLRDELRAAFMKVATALVNR